MELLVGTESHTLYENLILFTVNDNMVLLTGSGMLHSYPLI